MGHEADKAALVEATRRAVREMADVPEFGVEVERLQGELARVLVRDAAGELTPLLGFARHQGGGWRVLALGTDFDADFYATHGIPEDLQLR
ncbi:MAG: hypothetical protein VKS61_18885 [Candidatus Sericytochromatia bacterium]|nr:hypothetical protein [Candidatus Sericytochromatia bacterium]